MLEQHLSGTTAPVVIFAIAFAIVDLRTHRIPNALTFSVAVAGLMWNLCAAGGSGVMGGCGGLLTGLAVFLPLYAAGGLGAGDVKAMAAIGTFLGPKGTVLAAAWTLVIGAIFALVVLLGARRMALAERAWQRVVQLWPQFRAHDSRMVAAGPRRFPYGVAIACGTIASITWS